MASSERQRGGLQSGFALHLAVSYKSSTNPRLLSLLISVCDVQWRQRELKVGGTSLVSRLSACLTEANWWRLIAE